MKENDKKGGEINKHEKNEHLEGQELFFNRDSNGNPCMNSQDWIDIQLGVLPNKKYKQYYSPDEISELTAYEIRFPVCEHPVNVVFNDNSKGSYCPFGAYGEYNQQINISYYCDNCFRCTYYKLRKTPIKKMDEDTYKKYKVYVKGKQHTHLFKD